MSDSSLLGRFCESRQKSPVLRELAACDSPLGAVHAIGYGRTHDTGDCNEMTYRLCTLACVALLAIVAVCKAADAPTRTADILAQQQTIRAGMKAKRERYANMPHDAQKSVLSDQEKLEKLLEGKTETSQLALIDQAEVRRLLARIEATINNHQSERLVCHQEARTGSNYVTRVCRTPAQIREQKERGEKLLEDEASRIKCNDRAGCI